MSPVERQDSFSFPSGGTSRYRVPHFTDFEVPQLLALWDALTDSGSYGPLTESVEWSLLAGVEAELALQRQHRAPAIGWFTLDP